MKHKALTVLLAAPQQATELIPVLQAAGQRRLQLREAATTGGAYRVIGSDPVALMVLDKELPVVELDVPGLIQAATQSGVLTVTPEELLEDPAAWLSRATQKQQRRRGPLVLPLRLALTSLSGGTGKTSIGWALAQAAARLHVSVAVVEMAWGNGALSARLGLDEEYPDLYRVTTEQAAPSKVQGITVVPVRDTTWRLLLGTPEKVQSCLDLLARAHVLTIVDVPAGHPLYRVAQDWADRVAVFADTRPETVDNARLLLEALGNKALLVANRAGIQDRLALQLTGNAGRQAVTLPEGIQRAGNALLQQLYQGN